ncbi:MAG: hypothetical protein JXQ83_00410 [Candidatus Glassbacteria bacterium]|nr:hypothetical protein [Candidatus Glassbacteria bacterium]
MENLASCGQKLIRWKDLTTKRQEGYRVGVLHLHSIFSRDVPKLAKNMPDILVCKALREGADYVAITDHDNDDGWRQASYRHPAWIRGTEMEVHDESIGYPVHFGILNIGGDNLFEELWDIAHRRRSACRLVDTALQNGATVIANHPWWCPQGYRLNSVGLWDLVETFRLPVEVNSKRSLVENVATLIYAAQRNLPVVATTDSHTRRVLPTCTLARGDTPEEFLANIRRGQTYIVPGYAGFFQLPAMMTRYVLDVIQAHLAYGFYEGPVKLGAGGLLDRLLAGISHSRLTDRLFTRQLASITAGLLTYLVGTFGYIPYTYAASTYKVLKDMYLRSAHGAAPLPEFISE